MSLINDALKRAKQTQQDNPPATPALEFRAAEPGQKENRRTTLLIVGLSLVVVLILGLAGLLVWYVTQSKPTPLPVTARVADAPLPPLQQNATTSPTPTVSSKQPNEYIERPDDENTNTVPVVAAIAAAIQPVAIKLQGIYFNPSSPSAIVNGRTLYLGDRVNGFRLIAISPVAVTLVSATETNVLSLSGQ